MVVSPSAKQGWEKIHPTGAALEMAVSGVEARGNASNVTTDVRVGYCKKWNILVRGSPGFFCFT